MFEPLASTSDLTARNIAVPAGFDADELLASASDALREAAGCPISETTSTVTLYGDGGQYLDLPGVPVTSVATVVAAGDDLSDCFLEDSALYRCSGWRCHEAYTVTYTHGLAVIPKDIVDLACGLVAMAANDAGGGYGAVGVTQSQRIGTAAETFFAPAGGSLISPMAIPDAVRDRLRARFATSAVVVGFRR